MRTAFLLALAVVASGCMTMARGHTATVAVDANRDSAYVFVNDVPAGVAPALLELRRSRGHRLEIVREGYQPARAVVRREVNSGALVGGLVLGSFTGLAIDLHSGAIYDLEPGVVQVDLVPDSSGTHAAYVADRFRQARQAALSGFAEADPNRRAAAPWLTIQSASGVYRGDVTVEGEPETVGGIGASLAVGVRGERFTARVSGTTSVGFLFDNSERWEVAALAGVVTEAAGGRLRVGLSAGPGVVGGRTDNLCLFCSGPRSPQERLPTRVGVSALAEGYVFITPEIGVGLQMPVNVQAGDVTAGAMLGLKYEGVL